MYLKSRKYYNFGTKDSRRAWHVVSAQEVKKKNSARLSEHVMIFGSSPSPFFSTKQRFLDFETPDELSNLHAEHLLLRGCVLRIF